jgi:hypothetical protein
VRACTPCSPACWRHQARVCTQQLHHPYGPECKPLHTVLTSLLAGSGKSCDCCPVTAVVTKRQARGRCAAYWELLPSVNHIRWSLYGGRYRCTLCTELQTPQLPLLMALTPLPTLVC